MVYSKQKQANKNLLQGFPGSSVVKNLLTNAGDAGSIPDPMDSACPEQLSLYYWACALEHRSHSYWAHAATEAWSLKP